MNRKDEQKKKEERHIFKEFAKFCSSLEINEESIKSGDEIKREPDILCQLKDGSHLAFELTKAVDNKVPHRMDCAQKAEEFWDEYKNNILPKHEKERFDRIFSGCSITLNLNKQATLPKIKKAIKHIFKKYENTYRCNLGLIQRVESDLPNCYESIKIEPKDGEPEFRCSRAMSVSTTLVKDRIKNKRERTYETSCPIHLLIYSSHHSFGPDGFWNQQDTKTYIEENIGSSMFERIWIFDRRSGKAEKIVYAFPETNN